MKNKTIFITGSTDGIGKETASGLAKMGAHIILHARSRERGIPVAEEFRQKFPGATIDLACADLSDPAQIRKMLAEIKSRHSRIDVLINNAGILENKHRLTAEGFEMTFMVNYLSHFLITNSLLPLIKNSTQGRIINVSSMVHQSAKFDLKNLQGELFFDGYNAYACSKLENLLFTFYLASLLKNEKVTVNALHPGVINTKLLRSFMGGSGGGNVSAGAATSIYLASSAEVSQSGKYFVSCRESKPSATAMDKYLQESMWKISGEMIG